MDEAAAPPAPLTSLEGFVMERVLNADSNGTYVAVLGAFPGRNPEDKAIVKLSKRHFPLEQLPGILGSQSGGVSLELDFHNDIYCKVCNS